MRFPFAELAAAALALLLQPASSGAADLTAGYSRITVPGDTGQRGDPSNRLNVVVWYPAASGSVAAPIDVGPPDRVYFREGEAAAGAPIAASPARLPLIVVSHGTGGTSMDLSWLCASLAANGYIVASVEHPGNNALQPPTVAGMTLWWQRARDLSQVIDGLLKSSAFATRIDPSRIGAAGFSLGGYTVLAVAGVRASTQQLDAYCAGHEKAEMCSGEATPDMPDVASRSRALAAADPLFRAALAANTDSHRDPRVKAVFSIAPALGPAMLTASLRDITTPVEIVAGFGDPVVPVADNAIPDAVSLPNAALSIFPRNVAHYTFLTDCTPLGAKLFAPICADAGPGRVAVHQRTAALARTFFDRELGGNPTSARTSSRGTGCRSRGGIALPRVSRTCRGGGDNDRHWPV